MIFEVSAHDFHFILGILLVVKDDSFWREICDLCVVLMGLEFTIAYKS